MYNRQLAHSQRGGGGRGKRNGKEEPPPSLPPLLRVLPPLSRSCSSLLPPSPSFPEGAGEVRARFRLLVPGFLARAGLAPGVIERFSDP